MKTLRKIDLQLMQEDERMVLGGDALDNFAENMRKAGIKVTVYTDPDEVPQEIFDNARQYFDDSGNWLDTQAL